MLAEALRRLRWTDALTVVLFVALAAFLVSVARSQPTVAADAGAALPAPATPAGANGVIVASPTASAQPATRTPTTTPTSSPTATPVPATTTTAPTATATPTATAAPPTATATATAHATVTVSPTAPPARPTATNTPAPATPSLASQAQTAPPPPPAPGQVQGVALATGYVARGATQTVVGVASSGTLLSVTVTFANGQYLIARGYTDYQGVYRAVIAVPYGVPAGNAHVVVAGPLDSRWTNFTVG